MFQRSAANEKSANVKSSSGERLVYWCPYHSTSFQAPVIQILACAIQRITLQRTSTTETFRVVQCAVIYPMDGAMQPLNNWGLILKVMK